MGIRVEIRRLEARRNQPCLERRLVHATPAEEASALDNVQQTELGRHDANDTQATGTNIRARHVHGVCRTTACGQAASEALDELEHVGASERRDAAGVTPLR